MARLWAVVFAVIVAVASPVSAATPARYVGAEAIPWSTADSTIGPLHSDKLFYSGELPPSWPSDSYGLTPGTLAIIAYKTPTTNVVSYVGSIPADRPVVMVYWQEPEAHITSSEYLAGFEQQADLIHSLGRSNVHVASDSATYRYQSQFPASYGCQFVPPARYVDYYFADVYEPQDQGLANLDYFQRWLTCTQGLHRSRGIAEYGLGDCQGNGVRAQTLTSDAAYLGQRTPHLQVFEYWWNDNSPGSGTGCSNDWQFTDQTTIRAWRALLP